MRLWVTVFVVTVGWVVIAMLLHECAHGRPRPSRRAAGDGEPRGAAVDFWRWAQREGAARSGTARLPASHPLAGVAGARPGGSLRALRRAPGSLIR
jgi:hypothetical protein